MDPKPFNKDPFNPEWSQQAFALVEAKKLSASIKTNGGVKIAVADGECPYCGDHLHETVSLTAVTEGEESPMHAHLADVSILDTYTTPKITYEDVTFTCGCGISHPDAPKDTPHGCGTSFRLSLPVIS